MGLFNSSLNYGPLLRTVCCRFESQSTPFEKHNNQSCVNVSLSMLVKPESKLAMLVGNSTAWNMEFNPMVKCQVTKQLVEVMTVPTHFSAKLEQGNTFHELCLLTWNLP